MNYLAQGLSQGFANQNNSNSIINAMNTASLIQYRRDQQRLNEQYADIRQQQLNLDVDKWEMDKQFYQQKLDEMQYNFEKTQKQNQGKDFVGYLYEAMKSGDFNIANAQMHKLNYIKQIADQAGISSFDPVEAYSDESLRNLGFAEGMNKRGYLVVNKTDGTKELWNSSNLMGYLGFGNYYTKQQLSDLIDETRLDTASKIYQQPVSKEGINTSTMLLQRQKAIEGILPQQQKVAKGQILTNYLNNYVANGLFNYDEFTAAAADPTYATSQTKTQMFNNGIYGMESMFGIRNASDYQKFLESNASEEDKQKARTLYNQMIGFTSANAKDVDKIMADDLTKSTTANFESIIQQLNDYDPSKVSKIDEYANKLSKYFNLSPENTKEILKDNAMRSNFSTIASIIRKVISGSQVTVQEMQKFEEAMGSVSQSKSMMALGLKNILNTTLSLMDSARNKDTSYFDWTYGGKRDFVTSAINQLDAISRGEKLPIPSSATTPNQPITQQIQQNQQTSKLDAKTSLYLDNLLQGAE